MIRSFQDFVSETKMIPVVSMKGRTADEIVFYLHQWFICNSITSEQIPNLYYCGITNDVDSRIATHKCEDHNGKDIKTLVAIECDSQEIAAEVEDRMGNLGFDIGNPPHKGNGAASDSRFVYLYKKP